MQTIYHPVHIADKAYLPVEPSLLAQALAAPSQWPQWFPALHFHLTDDRGDLGLRWTVSGAVEGTSEIWLEAYPEGNGTFLHYFLHGSVPQKAHGRAAPSPHNLDRLTKYYRVCAKNLVRDLRRRHDAQRAPGEAPITTDDTL